MAASPGLNRTSEALKENSLSKVGERSIGLNRTSEASKERCHHVRDGAGLRLNRTSEASKDGMDGHDSAAQPGP